MKTIQFEITGKCNLKCKFCYNQKYMKKWDDIPKEDILEKSGTNNIIYIGGGEPMLYPELEELVNELIKNNNIVVISTNGTIYGELPKSENLQIQISLPAINKEIYEEITSGNIEKVKENILKYKENYKVFIHMPVYKENFSEIDGIAEFCRNNDLTLRISQAIPVNGINIIDNEKIERKALEILLSEKFGGINLVYPRNKSKDIEYYTPKGSKEYPFAKC